MQESEFKFRYIRASFRRTIYSSFSKLFDFPRKCSCVLQTEDDCGQRVRRAAGLRRMYLRQNMALAVGLLLAGILLRPMFACADSQIQGRPTRPKEFDNVGELKDYLNLVKDYYILNGKARYGKRAGLLRSIVETPHYLRELVHSKINGIQEAFETMQSNAAEKKKSNQHALPQERYAEDYSNLRIPYQVSRLKLSQHSNVLGKSNGRRK